MSYTKMLPQKGKKYNLIPASANDEALRVQEYKGCRRLKTAGLEMTIALP